MKRFAALFLVLALVLSLCACDTPQADPVKGTWFIDLAPRDFILLYQEPLNELLGIGDVVNLAENPPISQELTFLLVFDGQSVATAYLEISSLQNFLTYFFQSLLSMQTLYQLFGSQALAEAAMVDLTVQDLIYILQTQFAGISFAQEFATLCGYACTEEYLIIPVSDSYTFRDNQVLIGDSFLEYNETDLNLTQSAKLKALGIDLTGKPYTFRWESGRTEY